MRFCLDNFSARQDTAHPASKRRDEITDLPSADDGRVEQLEKIKPKREQPLTAPGVESGWGFAFLFLAWEWQNGIKGLKPF